MIIVPLIFASIVVAITNLGAKDKLKILGLGVGVYFVITTTIAILVAVFLASIISPGSILDLTALQESHDLSDNDLQIKDGFSLDDIPSVIPNVIPSNPIVSYLEGQMFSILVMALIVGLSMAALPKESVKPLLDILESIQKITLHILLFSMKIVPFAVFGLIVGMVATVGVGTMVGLGSLHGNSCSGSWSHVASIHIILKVCSKKIYNFYIFKISQSPNFGFFNSQFNGDNAGYVKDCRR